MVSEKSKSNLRRGNPRNKGNPQGRAAAGKTWQQLIIEHGEKQCDLVRPETGELSHPNQTWKEVVVRAAYVHAANGNAPILRELLQRSEPQADELKVSGGYALNIIQIGKEPTSAPDADQLPTE